MYNFLKYWSNRSINRSIIIMNTITEGFSEGQKVCCYFCWTWIVVWNTSAWRVEQYISISIHQYINISIYQYINTSIYQYIIKTNEIRWSHVSKSWSGPHAYDAPQSSGTHRAPQRTDQWTSRRIPVPKASLYRQLHQRWTCWGDHWNRGSFASSTPSSCSWRSVEKPWTFVQFWQTVS